MTKLLALATVCTLGIASSARAECREDERAKQPVTFHMETIAGKPTMVIDGGPIIVCGHPARPAVAYVTGPKDIDYAWLSIEQTMLPRILKSVEAAPFAPPAGAGAGGSR